MTSPYRWNYVAVVCACGVSKKIRIDVFNKKKGQWSCISCAAKLRNAKVKEKGIGVHAGSKYGLGVNKDPVYKGCYSSYSRAKRRVKTNHKGAYTGIEFRFSSFDQWFEELGPRPEGTTVDRIDPYGHYEPGNVRWATHKQQCRNRKNNWRIEYEGQILCLEDAAILSGVNSSTVRRRRNEGCPRELWFYKGRLNHKTWEKQQP